MQKSMYRPLRAKGAVFLALAATLSLAACSPPPAANLELESEILSLVTNTEKLPNSIEDRDHIDTIAVCYQHPDTKSSVIDFFASITKSRVIAVAILDNAVKQKVPASLAFAIAYEESRFDPLAVNQNTTSVDRGLFQLNSLTFPDLTDQEFFNPSRNAKEGIGYFRHVLELSGNEVSALAMYNAGRTRVTKQGAPMRTLDYISRILNYKKNIDSLFTAKVVAKASMVAKIRMGMLEQRSASIQ
ncbi:MAG: transglycosylase SLT domain-containing protein [Spirochaetia bacterium]|uniref:Transglycosylase SLT domain-containing protein n=1 Tax=bioreactor metagenome TaxID=1076179 RepID=A0A644SYT0_9ZZZZ|nr:transglycosylase SLT domain-containing protein [Spirochaetia bacterium]MDD3820830.1 transglycosylase SLT domain-containing protein [Spirochaetales bacterium]NLX45928.1 lytic transglycosylase domain-containing protein [Treponema sp.]VBB41190.1 exported hypothetical protein [uncultured Spirochaetota bacterium]MCE1208574.1 transglycosylase SLT domain-containing protein [Spirochaetia bacterium]